MLHLRRIATVAIGLALLQGNLAAVTLPCASGHGVPGADTSVRGVGSASDAAVAHAAMGHDAAAPDSPAGTGTDHRCDHGAQPENCASMVSCAAVGTPAAPTTRDARRPAVDLVIATTSDVPPSLTLLPEVPPPRV